MQSLASRASWHSRCASSRIPAKVARPVIPSGAVGVKQLRWADGVKLPKRGVSPTCVSRFSPEGVGCKEARKDMPELVLDRNTDRQRASVPSH
jgi:hypothetical protein